MNFSHPYGNIPQDLGLDQNDSDINQFHDGPKGDNISDKLKTDNPNDLHSIVQKSFNNSEATKEIPYHNISEEPLVISIPLPQHFDSESSDSFGSYEYQEEHPECHQIYSCFNFCMIFLIILFFSIVFFNYFHKESSSSLKK